MKKKGFLQFVSFAIALLLTLPAVAQNESVVTLSGNAYITSGQTAFIDEDHSAIRNWNDKETVISFYFRTSKAAIWTLHYKQKASHVSRFLCWARKKRLHSTAKPYHVSN